MLPSNDGFVTNAITSRNQTNSVFGSTFAELILDRIDFEVK